MDIHAQQSTARNVWTASKWASLVLAVGITFFTMLFCTTAGFGAAFLAAVILLIVGVVALRDRPSPAH